MRRGALIVAILGLAFGNAAAARPPVVAELYTAQGCSSCGKADAYLAQLADRKGVLVLTFGVDYWDYLGWKDTFAKPEFTERQRAYARRFDLSEVYTPQVVVDGAAQTPGARPQSVEALLKEARHTRVDPPDMRFRDPDRVAVGSGRHPKGGAEIWLIRYDPRRQDVEVKDGDNRGQTVGERNVVVQLERLGPWRGRPVLLPLPPAPQEGLSSVVIVQEKDGGRILGVLQSDQPAS